MSRTSRPIAALCWALLLAIGIPPLAVANDASLDPSFGQAGRTSATLPNSEASLGWFPIVSTLDSEGRVLLGGAYQTPGTYSNALVRWTADGELDTSFGEDGFVKMTAPYSPAATVVKGLAADSDGGVYVLFQFGHPQNGNNRSRLCHLDEAGEPVLTFGSNGTGCVSTQVDPLADYETAGGLARQPDGKLLVLGDTDSAQPGKRTITVRRFHANGAQDICFMDADCSTGVYKAAPPPQPTQEMAPLQIVAFPKGGFAYTYRATNVNPGIYVEAVGDNKLFADKISYIITEFGGIAVSQDGRLAVFRQLDNGEFAVSVANDCSEQCQFSAEALNLWFNILENYSVPLGAAWDTAGRLLIGGLSRHKDGKNYASVLRLEPDGTIDSNFGDSGRRIVGLADLDSPDEGTDRVVGIHELNGGTFITGVFNSAHSGEDQLAALRLAENYLVTPTWGANGSVTPGVVQSVGKGSTAEFLLVPDDGFSVASITGTCPGSVETHTLVVGPIFWDCDFNVTFQKALGPAIFSDGFDD